MATDTFSFEISLSVLNHLGRHLYRSFATVLGEAISNSWDADAKHVWIYIDEDQNGFEIADDGTGMSTEDFQNKFLKVGYSKRKGGRRRTTSGRPYIGRKGIGKLALLSCADRVTVITRKKGADWVGGVIDNSELDDAITDNLQPGEYALGAADLDHFDAFTHLKHGTVIRFDGLKERSRTTEETLAKTLALYFRFTLLDPAFTIYLNDNEITHKDLQHLIDKTQFIWTIGSPQDPLIDAIFKKGERDSKFRSKQDIKLKGIKGFIATVEKPSDLKIRTTDERAGIDLFVNGRLRERDILKHIPSARVPESYMYGQIHFDRLDDGGEDRFTSSREGVVADDPVYAEFLDLFKGELTKIIDQWDEWRVDIREEGDSENKRLTKSQRASKNLFNASSQKFQPKKPSAGKTKSAKAKQVDKWLNSLSADAEHNYAAYAECFIAENLVREHIRAKKIALSPQAHAEIKKWKGRERANLELANISLVIISNTDDLPYLGMEDLANLVDKVKDKLKQAGLSRDAIEFRPLRNAVAHTALLTPEAKERLKSVRNNIAGRVQKLLDGP